MSPKKSLLLAAQPVEKMTPVPQIVRDTARDLSPNTRKAAIQSLALNALLRSSNMRATFTARTGLHAPLVPLISPTMRCNLACEG